MLSTPTAKLPAEQRQRLHADFLANEQAYLQMRDSLLPRYRGQWVAVHEGKVLAASADLLKVTEAAAATGGHPYIALVGAEEAVIFRVRRVAFAYDRAYQLKDTRGAAWELSSAGGWVAESACLGRATPSV